MKLKMIAQINNLSARKNEVYYILEIDEEHSAILTENKDISRQTLKECSELFCAAFYKNSEYNTVFDTSFLNMLETNKCEKEIDLDLTKIIVRPYLINKFKSLSKLVDMYSKAQMPKEYNELLHAVDDYVYFGKIKEIIQKRKIQLDSFLEENDDLRIQNILKSVGQEKRKPAIKMYKRIIMYTLIGEYNLRYFKQMMNAYIYMVNRDDDIFKTDNDFFAHLLDDKIKAFPDVSSYTTLGDINQKCDKYFFLEDNER